jgi:hypothetical protein
MECYDPASDRWTLLESTSVGREGAGLVSLGENLFCIGGFDGNILLNSVERYDFNTGAWSMIANMLTPRSGAGCASINYKIIVVGGYDGYFSFFYKEFIRPVYLPIKNTILNRTYAFVQRRNL